MSKGDAYEQDVLKSVQDQLNRGNLSIDPKLCRVRHKPNYFSRDRGKDIIFDVSIEVSRRTAAEPYWIWIWECKNYNHTVPVNDVEEFHSKLSQVGANRTKGTMITLLDLIRVVWNSRVRKVSVFAVRFPVKV